MPCTSKYAKTTTLTLARQRRRSLGEWVDEGDLSGWQGGPQGSPTTPACQLRQHSTTVLWYATYLPRPDEPCMCVVVVVDE